MCINIQTVFFHTFLQQSYRPTNCTLKTKEPHNEKTMEFKTLYR